MSEELKQNYWSFDLSPYIFQIKNIHFQWLMEWWGIGLILIIFGGGYYASQKFIRDPNKRSTLQTILLYSFLGLITLFTLNKMNINWGLRWYSVMYLLGFIIFYFASLYWISKKSLLLSEDILATLIAYIIIGMLIGARIAYVFIYNWDYYKFHLLEAFATWQGGLSFHGAVIGMTTAIFLFTKKYKIPFFHLTDKMVLVGSIGIALGRIGNFMNGELWGRPIVSPVPWAIIFPEAGNIPRHPSQLYQSLGEGWCLFLTLFLISRFKQKEGTLTSCFIIFYCIYRFIVEYFRAADMQVNYFYLNQFDWAPLNVYADTPWWQIITMGQILCFIFFILGILMFFMTRQNIREGSKVWADRNNLIGSRIFGQKDNQKIEDKVN